MGASDSRAYRCAPRRAYRCFLVRCWLEENTGPGGASAWRFTVQQARPDSARRSFACFLDVTTYITAELAACDTYAKDNAHKLFRSKAHKLNSR